MFEPKSDAKLGEQSFTLFETVIALGMLVTVILGIAQVQGNSVYFSEFERNMTSASWIAKGVMAQVEYEWFSREAFKDMEYRQSETEVEDDIKTLDGSKFTYTVTIEEWKFPILDFVLGGGGKSKSDSEEGGAGGAAGGAIEAAVKKVLGDDILKIATVEVFWPEGAQRNSTELSLLLTNQAKVDEIISTINIKQQPGGKPPRKPNKPDPNKPTPTSGN